MPLQEVEKPKVIGLYGLPGSGKSALLSQLREELDQRSFLLYEGSEKIAEICPGGVAAFRSLSHKEKATCREQAVRIIQQECRDHGRSAVVTGHFLFKTGPDYDDEKTWTAADANVFTHIIYLDVPSQVVERQRAADLSRSDREPLTTAEIEAWKTAEKDGLRSVCYQHGILMSQVQGHGPQILSQVLQLLHDFQTHNEDYNRSRLAERLDEIVEAHCRSAETVLMFDADKTIAPFDAVDLFWNDSPSEPVDLPKRLFRSFGQSYCGFRQMMLEYESFGDDALFERRCEEVAEKINLYPEFLRFLQLKSHDPTFDIIIVTSGLGRVWSLVLERENLSQTVHVIGSGRLNCKFVVTPEGKRDLVARLQHTYKFRVWAFGDSPIDLPMLKQADDAIIVVAAQSMRSRSMDPILEKAINEDGFRARQLLLPADADISPRLSHTILPVVNFADLVAEELHPTSQGRLKLIQDTRKTFSKLLSTHMRDARISGHDLREVHMTAGYWLATNHVTEMIGLEQFPIPHVSGGHTAGYRLRHEERTSIIACMRGGEAMAFGVSKAFPHARFFHANAALDIGIQCLEGQSCVIVVDSVINEGTTVINFVRRIHQLRSSIRVIIIAGVAQAAAVDETGPIAQSLDRSRTLSIVALRVSQNKYSGSGGTDTGNRLFNTVYERSPRKLVLRRSIS